LSIGYPDADDERGVLLQSVGVGDPLERMHPVLDAGRVLALQERVERVHADASLVDYLMAVVQATRAEPRLRAGASTRAAIGLFRAARAYALVDGRDFLAPDDVRRRRRGARRRRGRHPPPRVTRAAAIRRWFRPPRRLRFARAGWLFTLGT